MKDRKKILLVASAGGHLLQLRNLLEKLNKNHDYCWVCFKHNFVDELIKGERIYYAYEPCNRRNIINFLKNVLMAIKIFYLEKPDIIISTGAGIAIPFFILGYIFNKKNIFVESFSRLTSLSLSGKILYHFSNEFFVQWTELLQYYPKALYRGKLL
ncbi:MAG: UDP-N-acetylglucosamine transferase subunit ALG14 [Bacteroidetes bacterium]|nr:UDP-N-acetylglucosamine transferase subunit ALG14 [Bacteroidota bacterium]